VKRLTFDGPRIAAELRVRFPLMNAALLQETVRVAGQVCDMLAQAREARIAARGEDWRANDSMAEAIAFIFNMESMSQADAHSHELLEIIDSAVHSTYCPDVAHHGEPSSSSLVALGLIGAGGFKN
jgi:hypothetical protein